MLLRWLLKRVSFKDVMRAFRPVLEEQIRQRWLKIPMERKLYAARKLGVSVEQIEWLENYLQSVVLERLDDELR